MLMVHKYGSATPSRRQATQERPLDPDSSNHSILFEATIVLALILLNGLFAMAEIALISVRKARLEQRAIEGDSRANVAIALTASPEHFLSTVQIGITMIGIFTGAFGGATIAAKLSLLLENTPIAPYAQPLSLGFVVLIITYFSLVLGELLPKRIAMSRAEPIALRVARPMALLARVAAPLVHTLSFSTRVGQRLLGLSQDAEDIVTEDELRHMARRAESTGELEESERHILERVLHLDQLKVTALMTPRTDIVWLDIGQKPEVNWQRVSESGHSQYLVCEGSIDEVRGVINVGALWEQRLRTGTNDLVPLLENPLYFPEGLRVLLALDRMKASSHTLAVIMDEFGGVTGMVTLHDMTAAVFFGTRTAHDATDEQAVRREDGSWLVPGIMAIHEFHALMGMARPSGESDNLYDTVGGLVMAKLGNIPTVGTIVDYGNCRIEVVDMDGLRVDKVLVQPVLAATPE